MMPAKVTGGAYAEYDSWHGYPTERDELLGHIQRKRIDDVVFVTGDIHTFIAGDVRTPGRRRDRRARVRRRAAITSQNLGETDLPIGEWAGPHGQRCEPEHRPGAIIDALRGINPWVDAADFDRHGFGLVDVSRKGFDVSLKRVSTIKDADSTATEPDRRSATRSSAGRSRSRA